MSLVETRRIYKCDWCGKRSEWGPGWRHRLILHKSHGGWDETRMVCSEACMLKLEAKKPAAPFNKRKKRG